MTYTVTHFVKKRKEQKGESDNSSHVLKDRPFKFLDVHHFHFFSDFSWWAEGTVGGKFFKLPSMFMLTKVIIRRRDNNTIEKT